MTVFPDALIVGDSTVIIGFEAVMLGDDVMIGWPEVLDNVEAVGSVSVFDDAPEKKFMIDAGKKLPNCELDGLAMMPCTVGVVLEDELSCFSEVFEVSFEVNA